MRYMIAHMLRGDAQKYHENLSRALASAYRLRSVTTTIDPHLTIKAPFDALSTDLYTVEHIVEHFVRTKDPLPYTVGHFGHFDGRVVFMDVAAPETVRDFIGELKEELKQLPWLEFKPHETNTKLHATLCYPKDVPQATEIVEKLTERGGKEFLCTLDTVAILRKSERRWEILKEFTVGGSIENSLRDI